MARLLRTLFLSVAFFTAFYGSTACSDTCSDSDCKTGNRCAVDSTGASECRLVCGPNVACPTNYQCLPGAEGFNYCTPMRPLATGAIAQKNGQWGARCNPSSNTTNDLSLNPDCDSAQSFWCHGRSPTDGEAYCTQFQCETNLDCAQGFACEDVNFAPNAITTVPQPGQTWRVCQKRSYCSECESDADCYPKNGSPMHCAVGKDSRKFCTTECENDDNCQIDAACTTIAGTPNLCIPRAGSCHGDGGFCSPCRSDVDCLQNGNEGVCYQVDYTNERFCTAPSSTACRVVNKKLQATCPKGGPEGSSVKGVSCFTNAIQGKPKDHCYGLIQWGVNGTDPIAFPGCWTPNREKT